MKRPRLVASLLVAVALALALHLEFPSSVQGAAADPPAYKYIGVSKCKKCHFKQWNSWKDTRMSKAFDILKKGEHLEAKKKYNIEDKDYTEDPKCLNCHTVGFGTESGYRVLPPDADKKEVKRMEEFKGVGCEMCHGPGEAYGKYMEDHMKTNDYKREEAEKLGFNWPKKETCQRCHNPESPAVPETGYVFDYEQRKAQGTHQHFKKDE